MSRSTITPESREVIAAWIRQAHPDLLDYMIPDSSDAWGPFLRALANDYANAVEFPHRRSQALTDASEAILEQLVRHALDSNAVRDELDSTEQVAWWREMDGDDAYTSQYVMTIADGKANRWSKA